jgi:DNA-binding protein HU-beta
MNKTELIDTIARECDLSKAASQRALDCIMKTVVNTVAKGDAVLLVGFGSFAAAKRAARFGRHPQTGAGIKIGATRTVKFTAGKSFKDAMNV